MEINEGFIVSSEYIKMKILKSNLGLKNYKFLTINSLKSKLFGYVCDKAILFLNEKYGLSFDLAKEHMSYYDMLSDKDYNNKKLNELVKEKKDLIQNGLYLYDPYFKFMLKKYPITFIIDNKNLLYKMLIEECKKYTKVYELSFENNTKELSITNYDDYSLEILACATSIKKLILSGISYDKISILLFNNKYRYMLKRVFNNFNIPLSMDKTKNILYLDISKKFLELVKTSSSFKDVFDNLDNSSKYFQKLINIINDYDLYDSNPSFYYDFLQYKLKTLEVEDISYKDSIKVSSNKIFNDDEYCFALGFNQGYAPKIYLDSMYLTDVELSMINMDTSLDKNIGEIKNIENLILNTKNLFLSYSNKINGEDLYPSLLIDTLNMKKTFNEYLYQYSKIEDNLRLGVMLNKYYIYKIENDDLNKYNLKSLKYEEYDNKYNTINQSLIRNLYTNENPIKLSYSSLKSYFECPFKFYCNKILNIAEYEDTLDKIIGSYAHKVLELSYEDDFDFDKVTSEQKNNFPRDAKTIFYLERIDEILKPLINYNKSHEDNSELNQIKTEEDISFTNGNYLFDGKLDKILYKIEGNDVYVVIIDYKTGKDVMSLDNVFDGLNLQLPIYMYLLNKYPLFEGKNIHIIGTYLQKVNIVKIEKNKDALEILNKNFRLTGYTIKDFKLISMLDKNFSDSDYIYSMGISKTTGTYKKSAKVFTSNEENELINLVDSLINQAVSNIFDAKFEIAPKKTEKFNGCSYCNYKDICNMKYQDIVQLAVKKYKAGDDNVD